MIEIFLLCLVAVLIYKIFVFSLSVILVRNDIADVSWGLSFILVAVICLVLGTFSSELVLLSGLVFVWGGRLAIRIFLRNKGKKEDARYAELRKKAGKSVLLVSFFKVYVLQGILALVVVSPLIIVATNPHRLSILDLLGVLIWFIGFYFEVAGDFELDNFKADPKNRGKILQTGLWKYSRHPNYFGELTMWWGIFLIAVSSGLLVVVGPLAITYLIAFVSGIPMLEKKYEGNRDYDEYKKRTSKLVPFLHFNRN